MVGSASATAEDEDYLSKQQREIGDQLDTQGDEFEDEAGIVIVPSSPCGVSAVPTSGENVMELLAMPSAKDKQAT